MKTEIIIIRVPRRLKSRLAIRAIKKQISMSRIVREAVQEWLDWEESKDGKN